MGAILSWALANSSTIIGVAGIIWAAISHAKVIGANATQNATANTLINTVTFFLDSYVQTIGIDKTVNDLRIELKGQVATLLARLGVFPSSTVVHALIDAGIDSAIEAAVNKWIGTHPTPKALTVTATDVKSNSGMTASAVFAPAKGT